MAEPLRKALGEVNFLPDHAALGRVRAAQRRHAPPPEMTRELRTCARLLSHESGAVRLLAVQQLLGVLRGATSTALSAQLLSPHLTDREVSSLQPYAPGPRPRVPSLQPRVPSLQPRVPSLQPCVASLQHRAQPATSRIQASSALVNALLRACQRPAVENPSASLLEEHAATVDLASQCLGELTALDLHPAPCTQAVTPCTPATTLCPQAATLRLCAATPRLQAATLCTQASWAPSTLAASR